MKLACERLLTLINLVLRKFLMYVTGLAYPSSITVSIVDEDDYGTISAHTCSKELNIPRASFSVDSEDVYSMFKASLIAVIESNTFNIV